MKLSLLLAAAVVACCALSAPLAAAQGAANTLNQPLRNNNNNNNNNLNNRNNLSNNYNNDLNNELNNEQMQMLEQQAYEQYQNNLREMHTNAYTFDVQQGVEVQCPVGARGLSIPPAHVKFWKQLPATRALQWSAGERFMCVPAKLRATLTPIIAQLKTERVISVDPLTVPSLMRSIGAIGNVGAGAGVERDAAIVEQRAMLNNMLAAREAEAQMIASAYEDAEMQLAAEAELDADSESDSSADMQVQGFGGFGYGGWGGWGGFGGWGRRWGGWGGWGGRRFFGRRRFGRW